MVPRGFGNDNSDFGSLGHVGQQESLKEKLGCSLAVTPLKRTRDLNIGEMVPHVPPDYPTPCNRKGIPGARVVPRFWTKNVMLRWRLDWSPP